MKILVINNSTKHLPKLRRNLDGHDIEIVQYSPGISIDSTNKDLVILSGGGGEGREANDKSQNGSLWYQDEMDFILNYKKPILGICMGFELVCSAYGSSVEHLGQLISGPAQINPTAKGRDLLNKNDLLQFESHSWRIPSVSSKHFEVLAESDTGIEVIEHKSLPIVATQFHPEISASPERLNKLIQSTLSLA